MLLMIKSMKELDFSQLMEVYAEGNMENGREFWPDEPTARQTMLAEQDFYQYLNEVFFATAGACCWIWLESGRYVSALRLEPYQDGLLLEALETAPDQRRKGYAKALIQKVLERTGRTKIYSHVSKHNEASLRSHESCGFQKILNYAVYADGSVMHRSYTLCFDPNT